MRTVRVAVLDLAEGERTLDGEGTHYLARVHRLGPGDTFVAFDPREQREAAAEIVRVDREAVTCRLGRSEPARAVPLRAVTLVQCLGKGDKLDEVIRSATALGVGTILVAESARSVPRSDPERLARREARWQALALDAARQSGRGNLPTIAAPRPLLSILGALAAHDALKLCLDPTAGEPLRTALAGSEGRELVFLVGPEGGLADEELELAVQAGFTRVRLGPFVLRTELAATAALAAALAFE